MSSPTSPDIITIRRTDEKSSCLQTVLSNADKIPASNSKYSNRTSPSPGQTGEHVFNSVSEDHHSSGNIIISRSDQISHDITSHFKAQDEFDRIISSTDSAGCLSIDSISIDDNPNLLKYAPKNVRIVCMADTCGLLGKHVKKEMLPPGDILIHTGSFSKEGGTDADYTKFNNFLKSAKNYYKNIIVVVSSGDTTLLHDKVDEIRKRLSCATHVLCNEAVEVLGITFYGAPQHTKKKSSSAKIVSSIFGQSQKNDAGCSGSDEVSRDTASAKAAAHYKDVPKMSIDVLITPTPAYGVLDSRFLDSSRGYEKNKSHHNHCGSGELLDVIKASKPSMHVHGGNFNRGYIDAFGDYPLTINCHMSHADQSLAVLCHSPFVIRAEQRPNSSFSLSSKVSWSFSLDSLF